MNITAKQEKLASKLGALALLLLVLGASFRLAIYPIVEAALSHGADVAALHERLSSIDAEAARIPALKQRLATVASTIVDDDIFWPGDTDNAVSIAVQTGVRQLLQSTGVNLMRLDSGGVQTVSGFQRHTVRAAFSSDDKEFVDVLVALARQRPRLRIEDLSLHGSEINRAADGPNPVFATMLNVEIELSGLGKSAAGDGGPP